MQQGQEVTDGMCRVGALGTTVPPERRGADGWGGRRAPPAPWGLGLSGLVEKDVSSYVFEAQMSDGIWKMRGRKARVQGRESPPVPPGCGSDELTSGERHWPSAACGHQGPGATLPFPTPWPAG